MDIADEAVYFRKLGKVHAHIRHHAKDVEVLALIARADRGVDGDGIHQDIHVAVVQTVRRRRQVHLRAGIRVGGTSANEQLADARGNLHHARDLGGIGQIDRGEWRWWGCGFGRVNDGDLACGYAQALPHSGQ